LDGSAGRARRGSATARHTPTSRAEAGRRVTLDQARAVARIRDAVEAFLVLDAIESNATGRAPLVQDPGVASFVRTATRQLRPCAPLSRRHAPDRWRARGRGISFEAPSRLALESASLPAADAHRHALLKLLTRVRAGREERCHILGESLVSEASVAELGLQRVALCDHFIASRPGASAVTGAGTSTETCAAWLGRACAA
jgi:hypothetical protein